MAVDVCGVRISGSTLYVANHVDVRRVSTVTGSLTTVAGNGTVNAGRSGASAAQFAFSAAACGTAVDKFGNLLVAGPGLEVLAARTGVFYGQSMTAGHVYALTPRKGNAVLGNPVGVALDHAGNIVVSDPGVPGMDDIPSTFARVLVVASRAGTFYGRKMSAGRVYAVAVVPGTDVGAVRIDRAGNLLVPVIGEEDNTGSIAPSVQVVAARTGVFYGQKMTAGHMYRVAGNGRFGKGGDGGPARRAELAAAGGVVADSAGNLVIADGSRVRVVAVRTGRYYGRRMTAGDIYSIAGAGAGGYSGDGGPVARALIAADTVALDGSGNVVLGCGHRVRVVAARSGTFYGRRMTAGDIYTVAGTGSPDSGDGGPALKADFSFILGTAEDPSGDLVFADTDSLIWAVMARSGTDFGRKLTAGDSYMIGGDDSPGFSVNGGPATKNRFFLLGGVADVTFDDAGNVVVAETGLNRVRVIAARTGTFYGQAMTAGDVYTIAGTRSCGFSGVGGPAAEAQLCDPHSVSTDRAGNLLVTDNGSRVLVIAAGTGTFYGQAMTAGDIYTIAGDGNVEFTGDGVPATTAGMAPWDAVADPEGNVIITDGNLRVRVVAVSTGMFYGQEMTAGDIYTIAGDGTRGFSGSGGPAIDAELGQPSAAAVDNSGNVVFADQRANVVWVVAASTGTFYGLPMTAGDIYVVAGNRHNLGSDGLGDGGPALGSTLNSPDGVAISPAGALLVGDELDNRIRAISR